MLLTKILLVIKYDLLFKNFFKSIILMSINHFFLISDKLYFAYFCLLLAFLTYCRVNQLYWNILGKFV